MCAIAGILNRQDAPPPSEELLRKMLALLRHRGPDQFGIYLNEEVALGNARLSIIDLSGGQQPISNETEDVWIVFNGEIFNYVELRAELEAKGHRFATHCDTEVIVHLYEDLGPRCLSKLNGDFAIAIWDERDRTLFLGRDRVGVRPLFYRHDGPTLRFASEIKSLLVDSNQSVELDPKGVGQVFQYWSTLSPNTCFKDVFEVPAGHYLIAKEGEIKVQPYWKVSFTETENDKARPLEDWIEELRHILTDSTRIRLRADVPVGAYLSGGLDSSTIAAIVRNLGVSRLETFSIAFNDQNFDESQFQRSMADFLGTHHNVLTATHEDIGQVFPEVAWHMETPVMRTAPAPMFMLAKLVRDSKFKVVLTGEGADEFLAGYDIFKEAKVRRFWSKQPFSKLRPLLLKKLYADIGGLAATGTSNLAAFFGHQLTETDRPEYSHLIRWRNNRRTCRVFSADRRAELSRTDNLAADLTLPPDFDRWHPLHKAQYLEISVFLSQYLLSSQGDRMGMARSVEGRFPFLDVRFLEFSNRVPTRWKINRLTEKYLLRQMAKSFLPESISTRGKRPYRAPIHKSFYNSRTPAYLAEILSPAALKSSGIFDSGAVGLLLQKLQRGQAIGETDDMAFIGIVSTQLVYKQFVESFPRVAPLSADDDVKVVNRARASLSVS